MTDRRRLSQEIAVIEPFTHSLLLTGLIQGCPSLTRLKMH